MTGSMWQSSSLPLHTALLSTLAPYTAVHSSMPSTQSCSNLHDWRCRLEGKGEAQNMPLSLHMHTLHVGMMSCVRVSSSLWVQVGVSSSSRERALLLRRLYNKKTVCFCSQSQSVARTVCICHTKEREKKQEEGSQSTPNTGACLKKCSALCICYSYGRQSYFWKLVSIYSAYCHTTAYSDHVIGKTDAFSRADF